MIPEHRDGIIHSQGKAFVAPKVDNRLGNQNVRIGQGIAGGDLTGSELKELREDKKEFHELKNELASDGTLSKEDRQALNTKLDENSKAIYDLRHN